MHISGYRRYLVFLLRRKVSWEGSYGVQRAYCQNCCLTTREKYFAIFAALARVDKVLGCSNFGNMPAR
jgi:hypothetical protein